jgi:hypothetical protein
LYVKKKTPWSESASELYRLKDRRLSAKLVPAFADSVCHVASVTDLYDRILDFLYRGCYFFQIQKTEETVEANYSAL